MIILILIGIVVLILQMISPIWGVVSVIIGPLIGAYAGVKLGFDKNNKHRQKLEDEKKVFFKNWLKHEAKESIRLIENGPVNLIPEDAWNSVVNSGNIALFETKATELSDIYFKIKNYNYEAKRVRDAIEESRLHPETTDKAHASNLKKLFDEKTKPDVLESLKDLERWLTVLKAESGSIAIKGTATKLIHTDSNGRKMER